VLNITYFVYVGSPLAVQCVLSVRKLTLVSEELVRYVHVELLKENSGFASVSATNAAGLNAVLVILV